MSVKFPVSGRYHANYHPIAIHTPHSTQNDSEDCTASPMHCRILYHPTVYIPHAHPPPPYTHHNASGTASLLPTPFTPHQSGYDNSNAKTYGYNSRDCNKYTGGQGNGLRGQGGQNHGYPLAHHNTHAKSQSHNNKYSGNAADGSHKYPTIAMSSRLPVQYNRRTAGSNVGSPAILRSGGGYASGQAAHKVNHITASNYSYATNGRARYCGDDQYYEINKPSITGGYGSGRKNCLSNNNNNNNYRGGAARLDVHGNDNGRPNNDTAQTDSAVVVTNTSTTLSSRLSPSERINADVSNTQEKPASPPPAPYSPMTRPLPTLSPPTPQVQFYTSAQNRYQPSSMPLSQTQQQQQQQPAGNQRSRYSVGQALSSANRKPSDKYSSTTGSQTTMLRQSKYKVNGIMQTAATTVASKLADDALGGAGDGPGRLPITPPGTPRTGHPAAGDQNQLSDTCHQMQALTL